MPKKEQIQLKEASLPELLGKFRDQDTSFFSDASFLLLPTIPLAKITKVNISKTEKCFDAFYDLIARTRMGVGRETVIAVNESIESLLEKLEDQKENTTTKGRERLPLVDSVIGQLKDLKKDVVEWHYAVPIRTHLTVKPYKDLVEEIIEYTNINPSSEGVEAFAYALRQLGVKSGQKTALITADPQMSELFLTTLNYLSQQNHPSREKDANMHLIYATQNQAYQASNITARKAKMKRDEDLTLIVKQGLIEIRKFEANMPILKQESLNIEDDYSQVVIPNETI